MKSKPLETNAAQEDPTKGLLDHEGNDVKME